MDSLKDLLTSIKRSTLDQTDLDEKFVSGIGNVRRNFTQPRIKSPVPQRQAIKPQDNLMSMIGRSPIGKGITNFQMGIENRTLPKVNLQQFAQGIQAPVPRFGAELGLGMAQELINTPQRLLEGGGRIGVDIVRPLQQGKQINPMKATGAVAHAGLPLLDLATLGGGTLVKGVGKQALMQGGKIPLRQAIKSGAKQGAGYGAVFGGLSGASEGDQTNLLSTGQGLIGGAALGGLLGGGAAGVGGLMALTRRTPDVDKQLRDQMGRYTKGQTPVKPKGMPKAQWDFQLNFNNKYKRNPYTPVFHDDLNRAISYEAEKRGAGLSIRDVNKDKNPLGGKVANAGTVDTNQVTAPKLRIRPEQGGSILDNDAMTSSSVNGGTNPLNLTRQGRESQGKLRVKLQQKQGGKILEQDTQSRSQSFNEGILAQEKSKIQTFKKEDKRTLREWTNDFYTDWVNRFEPIERLAKNADKQKIPLRPEKNPQYAIKSLLGVGGKAELRHKKHLDPIIEELGDIPLDDFDLFLKAKRDVGFGEIGRDIMGSDPETGRKVISALSGKYDIQKMESVANKLYQYQDEGLRALQSAGFISKDGFDVIKARNPNYVPFQRVMDDIDNYLGTPSKKAQQAKKPLEKIEGSERDILSPIESIIAQTYKMEAAIAKNNVAKSIAEFPRVVPAYKEVIKRVNKSSNNTISVWNNGKKEFYEVPEDINRAVKGLNEESMGTLFGILSAPANVLRQGATGRNIDFMLPNIIRDQLDAAINSKYGYKPVLGWIDGLRHIVNHRMGKGDLYEEYLNSGGKIFFDNMAGRKAIAQQIKDSTTKKSLNKQIMDWAITGFDTLGRFSEEPTRVGLYAQAKRKGAHPLEAAFEARESTVDFARMGAKMKVANSLIPFLNVQIQGFDKMIRVAKGNPKAFAMKMAVYGMLPQTMASVYNNFYHGDQYARLPDFEKETNIIIMTGNEDEEGNPIYLKIPKGHTTQLIMNPTDHFITWLAGNNPQSFGQLALATLSSTIPVIAEGNTPKEVATRTFGSNMPQFLRPGVEAVSNFNFFRAQDIVPFYMGKKPAEEQVFSTTPAIYRKLGEVTGISPLHLKNFAEGTLAGAATQPANIIDLMLSASDKEPVNLNKIPVIRRFRGSYADFDNERPQGNTTSTSPFANLFSKASASNGSKKTTEFTWLNEDDERESIDLAKYDKKATGFEKAELESGKLSDARKAYKSSLTDQEKQEIYSALGIKKDDVQYDVEANYDTRTKTTVFTEMAGTMEHSEFIDFLAKGRKQSVSGSYLANEGTLTELRDAGIISYAEWKTLKNLKIDDTGKVISGSGGSKGSKKAPPAFKLVSSQTQLSAPFSGGGSDFTVKTPSMTSSSIGSTKVPRLRLTPSKSSEDTKKLRLAIQNSNLSAPRLTFTRK